MSAVERVQTTVRAFLADQQCGPAQTVIAAVSGGPDSLALWHALVVAAAAGSGPRVVAVHIDHGLRGPGSRADAEFVAATARTWQVAQETVMLTLPRGTTPAAARQARYQALAAVAARLQPTAVLTAHQADDQAETVVHHLIRGSGSAGLRGMAPVTPAAVWASLALLGTAAPLWRPLLTVERTLLQAYCCAVGLEPREDPTNRDRHYLRPRLRDQLMPLLRSENPQVAAAIGRTARIQADDAAFLEQELLRRLPALLRDQSAGRTVFDRQALSAEHPAIQRAAVRHAAQLLGVREVSYRATEQLLASLRRHAAVQQLTIGGLTCLVDQQSWTLQTMSLPDVDGPQLLQPETASLAAQCAAGWTVIVQVQAPPADNLWWFRIDESAVTRLRWRIRRPGDRMLPFGAPGRRRVQDIFVDRRIAQPARAYWPLLTDDGAVVWIPGVARSRMQTGTDENRATIWIGMIRTEPHDQEDICAVI